MSNRMFHFFRKKLFISSKKGIFAHGTGEKRGETEGKPLGFTKEGESDCKQKSSRIPSHTIVSGSDCKQRSSRF